MKLSASVLLSVLALADQSSAECDVKLCRKHFNNCLKRGAFKWCSASKLDEVCGSQDECPGLKSKMCTTLDALGDSCEKTINAKNKKGCEKLKNHFDHCAGKEAFTECKEDEDCPLNKLDSVTTDRTKDVDNLDLYIDTDIMSKDEFDAFQKSGGEWVLDQKLDAYVYRRKLTSASLYNKGAERGLNGMRNVETVAIDGGNVDGVGKVTDGHWAEHLDLRADAEFFERVIKDIKIKDGEDKAVNVYAPDSRYVYRDVSYPWSTVGRVSTTGGGACTGTMVGRDLMLTAGHCMQWNDDGTVGAFSFTPAHYNGDAPFGTAWALRVYYWMKAEGPGLSDLESAYDYVVVVLNSNIGDLTGYAGYKVYNDRWNGGNYWQNMGYPGGLTGTQRPAFSGSGSIDTVEVEDISSAPEAAVLGNRIDMEPGHSGGPYWGWWSGETFPRIVGVCSAESGSPTATGTLGDNDAGGGQALWDLISYVRDNEPDSTF